MHSLFAKYKWAPAVIGIGATLTITALLWLAGAFGLDPLPPGFASPAHLIGLLILLCVTPGYLLFALGLSHRRTSRLIQNVTRSGELDTPLIDPPLGLVAAGIGAGAVYALAFNITYPTFTHLLDASRALFAIGLGQIVVWISVGATLASRIHVARIFLRLGEQVPVDLFNQSSLQPFARTGMGDLLLLVGALVLSTVQSIDAEFRSENYMYAFIVAIPAGLVLLLTPMYSVHRRLQAAKAAALQQVNALIDNTSRAPQTAEMTELEALLQHRDRIAHTATWPMDVRMVSRVILYGVIPPAAWVLAALVELGVEQVVGR